MQDLQEASKETVDSGLSTTTTFKTGPSTPLVSTSLSASRTSWTQEKMAAHLARARAIMAERRAKGEVLRHREKKGTQPFSSPDFDFAKVAERLKAVGITDDDICWIFGLSGAAAIQKWKVDDPDFKKACALGKEIAARHLVAAGFQRAKGYDDQEVRETWRKSGEGMALVGRVVTKKHVPADVGALVFMLCNIDKRYRSVQRMEISEKRDIHIKIDGNLDAKRVENLARKLLPKNTKDLERKFVVSTGVSVNSG